MCVRPRFRSPFSLSMA
ncbi:UNVERIFIED_CONTAM: hypothetical protein GTU68_002243 [Idotea baltica]|nr:hypothetical protein [Idotea baltica]